MKVFLSSTFVDLILEREAVLSALRKKQMSTLAMEEFLATPSTPLQAALDNLRNSDLMILLIGSKAGSLLADGSDSTYTSAEYDEVMKLGKEALVFVKVQKRWPWSQRPAWRNAERDARKKKALNDFKSRVGAKWTWDTFSTPDQLALGVIQAIDRWEARGRPGARKTFSSTSEYFAGKSAPGHFQLLDFSTTLLGRDEEILSLQNFRDNDSQHVCIQSGRGGVGKSKILHDWAELNRDATMFLKDEPLWHEDSDKEIPIGTTTLVVDDAHRQESFGKVLQLVREMPANRKVKLIVSTRPGSVSLLVQQVFRKFDSAQVTQLPELQELSIKQGRALAESVLGPEFSASANHLADIANNSPLVIVAGGRLIAARRIDPSTLTTLEEFRSTIFSRFLDEMNLTGPRFPIDPAVPLLQVIAALGPVDVERRDFQNSACTLFDRPIDEILATIDALAANGIITPRGKPIRILPDVLSDYILEDRCVGQGNRSTKYADRIYDLFGAHSLKGLMRNLSELDWRRGQSGASGLNLLDGIWADINQRFRAGDEYERGQILDDLSGAAIYQPSHVITLVRTAIDDAIQIDTSGGGSMYRAGQDHVLAALPDLLEATAYHPACVRESVTTLWELAKGASDGSRIVKGAQVVIERLASWRRFVSPALNFTMLVEAVHLAKRPDAFSGEYTPYVIIKQILERDGEFSEWQDEASFSLGGFGLNYAAVGPVRESALDYLGFMMEGDGRPAFLAVDLLASLLHNFLNRGRRISSEEEHEWQQRERERCFDALIRRLQQPSSSLLKARIYNAVRSASSVYCPEAIREKAAEALAKIEIDDAVAVIDSICTSGHELPRLTRKSDVLEWEKATETIMTKGRASLERLASNQALQASILIDETLACLAARVKIAGFHRFLQTFADRPAFLAEMYTQLLARPQVAPIVIQFLSVLAAIHVADPAAFRQHAEAALRSGHPATIQAASNNLRVFDRATEEDVQVIKAYGMSADPIAKRGALSAIAYMGKFTELRDSLKSAALAIHTEGHPQVACELTDAFGPYGVSVAGLSCSEAAAVATEFLMVEDWEADQGAIPRFLSGFANLFPDETFALLLRRIELSNQPRQGSGSWFRTLGLVHGNVSFGGVPQDKRLKLGQLCMIKLMEAHDSTDKYVELFWDVAGINENVLQLILDAASTGDEQKARNIVRLIYKAPSGIAFTNPVFAGELVRQTTGEQRKKLVEALAYQARRPGLGIFAGSPETHLAEEEKQFAAQMGAFPEEPGLEDLARALRRLS